MYILLVTLFSIFSVEASSIILKFPTMNPQEVVELEVESTQSEFPGLEAYYPVAPQILKTTQLSVMLKRSSLIHVDKITKELINIQNHSSGKVLSAKNFLGFDLADSTEWRQNFICREITFYSKLRLKSACAQATPTSGYEFKFRDGTKTIIDNGLLSFDEEGYLTELKSHLRWHSEEDDEKSRLSDPKFFPKIQGVSLAFEFNEPIFNCAPHLFLEMQIDRDKNLRAYRSYPMVDTVCASFGTWEVMNTPLRIEGETRPGTFIKNSTETRFELNKKGEVTAGNLYITVDPQGRSHYGAALNNGTVYSSQSYWYTINSGFYLLFKKNLVGYQNRAFAHREDLNQICDSVKTLIPASDLKDSIFNDILVFGFDKYMGFEDVKIFDLQYNSLVTYRPDLRGPDLLDNLSCPSYKKLGTYSEMTR